MPSLGDLYGVISILFSITITGIRSESLGPVLISTIEMFPSRLIYVNCY